MNIYTKHIVEFMAAKQARLKTVVPYFNYFNNNDMEYIQSLPENTVKKIWNILKETISDNYYFNSGLTTETCPFCILNQYIKNNSTCKSCNYHKNHGGFHQDGCSVDFINGFNKNYMKIAMALSKTWYKKIIREIDK